MTREEAIERVRTRFDKWALDNEDLTALQSLGLVDAESKDEKIRKAALEGIEHLERNLGWDAIGDIDILDVKEYLEKLKEQPTNEEMLRTLRTEYEKGVADTIAKYEEKEQKPLTVEDVVEQSKRFGREVEVLHKDGQKLVEADESTKRLNDNWMKQHFDDYKEQKPNVIEGILTKRLNENSELYKTTGDSKYAGYWTEDKNILEQINWYLRKQSLPNKAKDMVQWTGDNLKEVVNFTGKSPNFDEWFKSWEEYEEYVHSHGDIFKLFSEDGTHCEVPVGAWIMKTPEGYNVPSKCVVKTAKQKPTKCSEDTVPVRFEEEDGDKYPVVDYKLMGRKSAEWSEEDNEVLQQVIADIEDLIAAETSPGFLANYNKHLDWLKSLPERFNLQPKQEWSEEDELTIADLINYFEGDSLECSAEEMVQRIKSLHPQYHGDVTMTEAYKIGLEAGKASSWKPSEEQMEALERTTRLANFGLEEDRRKALVSLYEQLKKMKAPKGVPPIEAIQK